MLQAAESNHDSANFLRDHGHYSGDHNLQGMPAQRDGIQTSRHPDLSGCSYRGKWEALTSN